MDGYPHMPTTSGKAVLRPEETARRSTLLQYPVAGPLGVFVERTWAVHWDLPPGIEHVTEVVSQPCFNLTFHAGSAAMLHGVGSGVSRHPLSGSGRFFGLKFRPGGFRAFTGLPAHTLTDRSVPAAEVFPGVDDLGADGLPDEEAGAALTGYLAVRAPEPDERYADLLAMVSAMLHDRRISRTEQVARRFNHSERTLQRLFREYIGVSPKWMIQRYRLHDAAHTLAHEADTVLADLAAELGWSDQAHFTRDFKHHIGLTPGEYAAECASADALAGYSM
ncbi:AraC family transcriptional regulator [Salininema proteolyticum]|uniref:Helix-turn-helix domain-containing protein n=1 Tax=Salininema proteolyticum TaxID=1607685 RepID=A0ABV8U3C9_9ACTN